MNDGFPPFPSIALVPERELTGPRWSAASMCARWAVYQHMGAPTDQDPLVDPEQKALWAERGQIIGAAYARFLNHHYPGRFRFEVEVPWPKEAPIGVGHADIVDDQEKEVIEVKSVKAEQGGNHGLRRHHAIQAAGYAINLNLHKARLVYIDPASHRKSEYPINVREYVDHIQAIQDTVVLGIKDGVEPERACQSPNDDLGRFCPFRDHCFQGWEPDKDVLIGYEPVVRRLAEIQTSYKGRGAEMPPNLRKESDGIKAVLRPLLAHRRVYRQAGVSIRINAISPRRTFRFKDAETAGYTIPKEMEPFVATSDQPDRWFVSYTE